MHSTPWEMVQGQSVVDNLATLHWLPQKDLLGNEDIKNIDWDRIRWFASNLNKRVPCKFLGKTNTGLNYLIKILEVEDITRWIVRIPLQLGKCEYGSANCKAKSAQCNLFKSAAAASYQCLMFSILGLMQTTKSVSPSY